MSPEIVGYKIVFCKNQFDETEHEHKFTFFTILEIQNPGKEFTNPKNTIFKQYVKSLAKNVISGEEYLKNDFHDDQYSIADFSDIGQKEPDTSIYRIEDNPGIQNTHILSTTNIYYEFNFYQTIGVVNATGTYKTPEVKVTITGKGKSASMKVYYDSKTIEVTSETKEIVLMG